MKKILVTGGSSAIGKAFIKRYKKHYNIVAPSREKLDLLDAHSVADIFKSDKFDAVVHLACASERGEDVTLESENLIMFKNIQYMAIANGVKQLIVLGNGAEFDRAQPMIDIAEDASDEPPADGYGMAWHMITKLAAKDKITTVLRLFDIYGAGSDSVITKIVTAGARGKKHIVIDSDRIVSAISVDDVAKVIDQFLRKTPPKGDYNVVSDKVSYLSVARYVRRTVRRNGGDIDILVKNDEPENEFSASSEKLHATVNVRLTQTMKGIKALYEELAR